MAQRKKAAAAALPEPTPEREALIANIVEIAKRLSGQGLELLQEQAKVVEYKDKIEAFNAQLNVAKAEALEARRKASAPNYSVTIERTEDDFFLIQLDDVRVFFNLEEMRALTRTCHRAKDPAAGSRMLYRWFESERSDLLSDAGINSNRNPYLGELYDLITSTYTVRE